MKNQSYKNLIILGAIAIFVLGFNYSNAYSYGSYSPDYGDTVYGNNIYNRLPSGYTQPQIPNTQNYQQQSNIYVQPQVQYVAQPTTTQIQYVPQTQVVQNTQPNIKYVSASSQGASAVKSVSTTTAPATVIYKNKGQVSNTGKYISYDTNNQMGASTYNSQQQGTVTNDTNVAGNGVTALSINGSRSFMPSSIFQWLMFIVIMLAIIIIARMIVKKSNSDDPHAVPVH